MKSTRVSFGLVLFSQANRRIGLQNKVERVAMRKTTRIERTWQAQNTEKGRRCEPLPEIATTPPETPRRVASAHSSPSPPSNHMLHSSLRATTTTRAAHTLKIAARNLSSKMSSSATLDLGAESRLSDKKAVRKQLHSLLSSLPSDHVQRQCPSSVVVPDHP